MTSHTPHRVSPLTWHRLRLAFTCLGTGPTLSHSRHELFVCGGVLCAHVCGCICVCARASVRVCVCVSTRGCTYVHACACDRKHRRRIVSAMRSVLRFTRLRTTWWLRSRVFPYLSEHEDDARPTWLSQCADQKTMTIGLKPPNCSKWLLNHPKSLPKAPNRSKAPIALHGSLEPQCNKPRHVELQQARQAVFSRGQGGNMIIT